MAVAAVVALVLPAAQGGFVAAGGRRIIDDTSGYLLRSADGVAWTEPMGTLLPPDKELPPLYDIAYGNGAWVAVGAYSSSIHHPLVASRDLRTWTFVNVGTTSLSGVAFGTTSGGQDIFVAVGTPFGLLQSSVNPQPDQTILTSPDGFTWTQQVAPLPYAIPLSGVVYAQGKWWAYGGEQIVLSSPDGVNWSFVHEDRDTGTSATTDVVEDMAPGGGQFAVVHDKAGTIATFTGATWTDHATPVGAYFRGVAYGNGTWVAAGGGGPRGGAIVISQDNGVTWVDRTPPGTTSSDYFYGVAYGRGRFVVVEPSLHNAALTSTDGRNWTRVPTATSGITTVRWDGRQFVAVGFGATCHVSPGSISCTRLSRTSTSFRRSTV